MFIRQLFRFPRITQASRIASYSMNRPRNRQPRPPRDDQRTNQRGGGGRQSQPRRQNGPTGNVPTIQQVIPGASVSIVLKADQPTGREVQGVVQELLTRGNHPRGIKVRLQDGRVGRVQRMAGEVNAGTPTATPSYRAPQTDMRYDGFSEGPPPRSLADFIPDTASEDEGQTANPSLGTFSTATAKCPMCSFEGDEVAVSHHVDEHFR